MGTASARPGDPLTTLREYRQLAPWNLRDLATVAGAILETSGVRPTNAAASARPSERTIRYYVTQGLVTPPEGRGTAAIYSYRHLLQVLTIKLRQMEGATLDAIAGELHSNTGDVLERQAASTLGAALPPPNRLPLTSNDVAPRGRAGRALRVWAELADEPASPDQASHWFRVSVSRGVELHVRDDHPLAQLPEREDELADAVRLAVTRLLSQPRPPDSGRPPEGE